MSLPQFDVQGSLFESLGAIAPELFADNDKYKLFAKKVWPVLAQCREQLAECYQADNGRPGVEPIVLLGVLIFQFLERVPDRQAVEHDCSDIVCRETEMKRPQTRWLGRRHGCGLHRFRGAIYFCRSAF